MKITEVTVHPVAPLGSLELGGPGLRLGWVFVEVHTDEGVIGVGECSSWPSRGDVIISHIVQTVRDFLVGRDPAHIEAIWRDLFGRYTYLGNRGPVTTVISGIDQALWDIKGKVLDRPVYDLLGGPVRDSLPLYTHPWGETIDEIAQRGRTLTEDGYEALKFDPFLEMATEHFRYLGGHISRRGIRGGVEMTAAVREAVAPDVEILIDAHGNFNVATAVQCMRALQPFDITWFEEPVPPESLDALRQVRTLTDMNICVGERLFTRWDFQPVLAAGLASYVMPDVCWTGGISELKKISTLAETYLVPVAPHGAQGPIQLAAGGHVMLTVPNCHRMEINSYWLGLCNEAVRPALDIRDGRMHVPDRPGLGFELDHDFIADHPDPDWISAA